MAGTGVIGGTVHLWEAYPYCRAGSGSESLNIIKMLSILSVSLLAHLSMGQL